MVQVDDNTKLVLAFAGDQLPSLRALLDRALNTLEPQHWPEWVKEVSATVDLLMITEGQA